jgi:hypothetical protein
MEHFVLAIVKLHLKFINPVRSKRRISDRHNPFSAFDIDKGYFAASRHFLNYLFVPVFFQIPVKQGHAYGHQGKRKNLPAQIKGEKPGTNKNAPKKQKRYHGKKQQYPVKHFGDY